MFKGIVIGAIIFALFGLIVFQTIESAGAGAFLGAFVGYVVVKKSRGY